jgi:hypothetical protein
MSGRIEVGETCWRFSLNKLWRAGTYSVRVSPGLEDACGNTPYAPFDGPLRSGNERDLDVEKTFRSIRFVVERSQGWSDKPTCPNLRSTIEKDLPPRPSVSAPDSRLRLCQLMAEFSIAVAHHPMKIVFLKKRQPRVMR